MADVSNRGEMPFLDHLEELRWRLLKSLVAIVLGTVVGWLVVQRIDIIGLLTQPIAAHLPGGRLNYTSPTDPFFITLKFAFIVGVVVSSPVVVFQLWAFLAPALYEREKRMVVPSLIVGVILFLGGAAAGYFLALPHALSFLLGFQNQALQPIITADRYFAFAAQVIVAMGAVTELPLVIIILTSLGVVTPQGLRRNRRIALLFAGILAAFLAPPDALSMIVGIAVLLVFYEVGILCATVVTRRRAAAAARAGAAVAVLCLAFGVVPRGAAAQRPVPRPPQQPRPGVQPGDTTRRADSVAGHLLDTATARKLGLPTGPTRSFPSSDAVLDTLLKLKGYSLTHYMGDTLLVLGGDSSTLFLTGETLLEREGTKLEADTVHYRQSTCRLDAAGNPRLFDQGSQGSAPTVVVGEGMRYDTCLKRGTVQQGLTTFQQGGGNWFMRANIALDSGSTRLYGAHSNITSDERPVPDYHFAAGEMKWLNKTVMIARPTVLYVRDVPIMWLPFIFNDIRPGRHSGMLVPRFGLNDLVRPTRTYQRHVTNIGYYIVLNDYVDVMAYADWNAGRNFAINSQMHYKWLDQFVDGHFAYSRLTQLDAPAHSDQITWYHTQSFSSRTHFSASVNYATSASVVQRNTIDPFLTTAQLSSNVNFDKRFDWGAFNLGGSMSQNLATNLTQQSLPRVSITPAPIDLTSWITWSPGFSYTNTQTFHNLSPTPLFLPNASGGIDTLARGFDNRVTDLAIGTPLRIGRWNWSNSFTIEDKASNQRVEFLIPDPADSTLKHHVVYDRTFETRVDWSTGFGLPQLFPGTWHIQPGIGIANKTSAGPYMLRNQFTGGQFLQQGKRLQFSLGAAPTVFGFFPGIGPFSRIRHSIALIMNYQYAPGAKVDPAFAHALDPTGRLLNSRSDPQQTITLGLSQTFEAKFKPAAGDTGNAPPRKVRLLSLNTSGISYNIEQAKMPGRTGWQTQTLTNTFASDLLPGFNFQMTHDLWDGQVGLDTTKFDPFLSSLSASFSLTERTFAGIGALLGLGHRPEPGTGGAAPPPPGGALPGSYGPGPRAMGGGFGGMGGLRGGYGGGGGRGFNLNVQFSLQRTRPRHARTDSLGNVIALPGLQGGNQQMSLSMAFSPTPHWTASWQTNYDFETKRFPQHYVRLERDLHRWHASFAFSRTASGNFAFNFYIALLDEPDIKFDYDQQSYLHTSNP